MDGTTQFWERNKKGEKTMNHILAFLTPLMRALKNSSPSNNPLIAIKNNITIINNGTGDTTMKQVGDASEEGYATADRCPCCSSDNTDN